MKNLVLAILLIGTLTFAGLYVHERGKARQAASQQVALTQEVEEARAQLAEKEEKALRLEDKLSTTRSRVIANADQVTELQQAMTNQAAQAATNSKNSNPLAEMFKNPEMKDLIKNQQKTMFSTIVDKSYSPFFKGMQLSPEQTAALKEMITKKSLAGVNMGMSMMTGDNDPEKRKEMLSQVKTETDAVDAEIKQFLGDANYTQFQEYEKSIPDRMAVSSFKDQQASGAGALTQEQEEQLVQVMSDERQHFKFTTDFSDKSKLNGDFADMFTDEKIAQFQTEQEQLNKQYLARAQNILSADQMAPFEKFLTGQRDMQAVGMKMAVKMFGGKKSGS